MLRHVCNHISSGSTNLCTDITALILAAPPKCLANFTISFTATERQTETKETKRANNFKVLSLIFDWFGTRGWVSEAERFFTIYKTLF